MGWPPRPPPRPPQAGSGGPSATMRRRGRGRRAPGGGEQRRGTAVAPSHPEAGLPAEEALLPGCPSRAIFSSSVRGAGLRGGGGLLTPACAPHLPRSSPKEGLRSCFSSSDGGRGFRLKQEGAHSPFPPPTRWGTKPRQSAPRGTP